MFKINVNGVREREGKRKNKVKQHLNEQKHETYKKLFANKILNMFLMVENFMFYFCVDYYGMKYFICFPSSRRK